MEGPLADVRVVDFTHILAGPYATQILGDLGARIVKVESPRGDETRSYGSVDADGHVSAERPDPSPAFASFNRNKESIVIDLKHADGRFVAAKLAVSADVVVHNFRPGVMEQLGLGYDDLRAAHPTLVYCEISGFGSTGPLAQKGGNDLISQAYSGLLSFTGEHGGGLVRCPISISDVGAALYATIGIVSALLLRERTGVGQKVDTSLLEGLIGLMGLHFVQYLMTGFIPVPMGTQNKFGQPNQVFKVADGWIAVSAINDRMWNAFCSCLDRQQLSEDPRFHDLPSRFENRDELITEVEGALRTRTVAECVGRMDAAGVLCAPVNRLDEVVNDPQMQLLGCFTETEMQGQRVPTIANPVHLSASPATIRKGPPALGEDGMNVLTELGFSVDELRGLHDRGAISLGGLA